MKILLERSGGFAGLIMTATLDTAQLSPQELAEVQPCIAAANLFESPESFLSQQPDRFQYRFEVTDGDRHHSITFGESAVPAHLRPLLDWLVPHLRGNR